MLTQRQRARERRNGKPSRCGQCTNPSRHGYTLRSTVTPASRGPGRSVTGPRLFELTSELRSTLQLEVPRPAVGADAVAGHLGAVDVAVVGRLNLGEVQRDLMAVLGPGAVNATLRVDHDRLAGRQ